MSCVTAASRLGVKRQISRRTWERPRKNVESAASSRLSPAFQRTNRYGPSPIGSRPNGAVRHAARGRSEEHTAELQSRQYLVCRLLLEKKKKAELPGTL